MDGLLKTKFGRELKDYVAITFGLVCYAFGWVAFMLPYQISTGGLTGISALIYYVTGIEIQVSYFILNGILMIFALKILGPKFCIKTLYAIPILTFFLWFFHIICKFIRSNIINRSAVLSSWKACIRINNKRNGRTGC